MLRTMSSWDKSIEGSRAAELRELLCKAAAVSHRANGARFEPEELGDDGLMYGLATTTNARHLAARAINAADLEDVTVCERGKVWWLEVQREDGTAFHLLAPAAAEHEPTAMRVRQFTRDR